MSGDRWSTLHRDVTGWGLCGSMSLGGNRLSNWVLCGSVHPIGKQYVWTLNTVQQSSAPVALMVGPSAEATLTASWPRSRRCASMPFGSCRAVQPRKCGNFRVTAAGRSDPAQGTKWPSQWGTHKGLSRPDRIVVDVQLGSMSTIAWRWLRHKQLACSGDAAAHAAGAAVCLHAASCTATVCRGPDVLEDDARRFPVHWTRGHAVAAMAAWPMLTAFNRWALTAAMPVPQPREAHDAPSGAESSRVSSAPSTEASAPSRSAACALWCSAKVRLRPSAPEAGKRQATTRSDTLREVTEPYTRTNRVALQFQ